MPRLLAAASVAAAIQFINLSSVPAAAQEVDFNRDIRPLLAKRCIACHGSETAESDLRLDIADEAWQAIAADTSADDLESAPIVPFHPELSGVLERVQSDSEWERMPPEGDPLTAEEIELLRRWIAGGAKYETHWSFQPVRAVEVPASTAAANPIDAFIEDRLAKADLSPLPKADARTLVRRLYYSTIGLPPSEEVVNRFAAAAADKDRADLTYERLVDQLLADPQFGHRIGRMWLDVVRYAETNSYERDGVKANAWRYRDWVIDSLNADKPYDLFIRQQIAGDEIALRQSTSTENANSDSSPASDIPSDVRDNWIATGYWRLGIWDDEPADPLQSQYDEYDDLVSTTSAAFLGLTLGCARCHDHKIDPMTQRDYYSMVAMVRDVGTFARRGDPETNNQIDLAPPQIRHRREEMTSQIAALEQRLVAIEQEAISRMEGADQRATEGAKRREVLSKLLPKYLDEDAYAQYQALRTQVKHLKHDLQELPVDAALGLAKTESSPEQTFVLSRGSPMAPTDPVEPAFLSLLADAANQYDFDAQPTSRSSGRRTALADWIASEANWFTARVWVNRIWQQHFGRGLVRSANNFGQMGDPPTHPELLDYLAGLLMRYDWNSKPIHRLILTSNAYRRASFVPEDVQADIRQLVDKAAGRDQNNDLFWRFDLRRLSAEEVRDSMLTAAGTLNLEIHGPWMYPEVSDEVKSSQSKPGSGWFESSPAQRARRSIYIHIKRSLIPPELSVFDFPETDSSCEARFLTTQAAQALNLLNGSFARQCGQLLAARIADRCDRPVEQWSDDQWRTAINHAVSIVYQRESTLNDRKLADSLLMQLREKHNLSADEAWQAYCLVLLNTNEFLYVD